ncbi:MAG: copper resistance CopC family protein [Steroidobacteraceae bacterium]
MCRTHLLRLQYVLMAIAGLLFVSATAQAHSSLTRTVPANGAVLDASPAVIEMSFRDAVRLTSVVVVKPDRTQLTLTFTPAGSAASFKVNRPQLAPGRNEIRWKALSKDGHVIGGTLLFTLEPAAAAH